MLNRSSGTSWFCFQSPYIRFRSWWSCQGYCQGRCEFNISTWTGSRVWPGIAWKIHGRSSTGRLLDWGLKASTRDWATDVRGSFPFGNDFNQDLSQLDRIDLIGTFHKAQLESRSSKLSVQLACVFSIDGWSSLLDVKDAFDRLFINAACRLDLVDMIVNIDFELCFESKRKSQSPEGAIRVSETAGHEINNSRGSETIVRRSTWFGSPKAGRPCSRLPICFSIGI